MVKRRVVKVIDALVTHFLATLSIIALLFIISWLTVLFDGCAVEPADVATEEPTPVSEPAGPTAETTHTAAATSVRSTSAQGDLADDSHPTDTPPQQSTPELEGVVTVTAQPASTTTAVLPVGAAELQAGYSAAVIPRGCAGAPEAVYADQWCFSIGQSTSYVAWRLNNTNEWGTVFSLYSPPGMHEDTNWGHAADWHIHADNIKNVIVTEPAVGHVAAWTRSDTYRYGRVGYIEQVMRTEEGAVAAVTVSTMSDGEVQIITEECRAYGARTQCGEIGWYFNLDFHYQSAAAS